MRRPGSIAVSVLASLAVLSGATAGPSEGGLSSDNIEFVQFIPFEAGTATGAGFWSGGQSKYMIITGWKSFSIYDISDPENPARESSTPFGFKFENEDVATNGEIMLFSESIPQNILHVWSIEDVTNPVEIAQVQGAGAHTTDCILDCTYAYGSEGQITDLRDPNNPVLLDSRWDEGTPGEKGHDINEVAPGLVFTSTNPMMLLAARRDPAHPKLLALSEQSPGDFVHSNAWPRNGTDRWALSTGETWTPGNARCGEDDAGLTTWDTKDWKRTHTLKQVDTAFMVNGTYADGNPGANAPFGCSSHWFETHPSWNDGGLLVGGWYNHGTRIHQVDAKGQITEVAYFLPHAGGTSAAYWVNDRVIYAVDYQRGLDVLRYTGRL